jgi:hypothetical protein
VDVPALRVDLHVTVDEVEVTDLDEPQLVLAKSETPE